TPYTPASTSTTVARNETVLLTDEIKKYDTAKLIEFLQKQGLSLSETVIKILEEEEINGCTFFKIIKEELERYEMKLGSATALVDFAKDCKDKKLKAFSSYKTKVNLEKVLQEDYKISSGNITLIPQFKPVICLVDENSPEFKLCIDDILRRIRNMRPVVDSNEAMRCDEINTGRVDYAIKKILNDLLEEIICITEGKQNQATMDEYKYEQEKKSTEGIYSTSRIEYRISLTENALQDDIELRKNVKRILEVIVGLLKDRALGSEEPTTKKSCVEEIIKKK
ncbi:2598_t:CDS:2, partial [Funneliformis caledonium]